MVSVRQKTKHYRVKPKAQTSMCADYVGRAIIVKYRTKQIGLIGENVYLNEDLCPTVGHIIGY